MNIKNRKIRVILPSQLLLPLLILGSLQPLISQDLTKKRPDAINKLMKAVGNEQVWKNAKGFHMLEIAHYASLELPLIREFWIDFQHPRIKIITRSAVQRNERVFNTHMGWTIKGDTLSIWEENKVQGYASFWPGIPSRIFHLIAKNDPSLTYSIEEDRINFYINGEFAVWIATDNEGNPVAYGRSNNHAETHFLGQMLDYGPVRLWKEAHEPGGQWKVVMVDYQLLDDLSPISYDLPEEN